MANGIDRAVAFEKLLSTTVLIVDHEGATRDVCGGVIAESGLRTRTAATTEEALEALEEYSIDIVVTALHVPKIGGLELLKLIRRRYPEIPVMVLTPYGTIESAVEATRIGATDYVTKPFHIPELRSKLEGIVRMLDVAQESRVLREQLRAHLGFGGLIGVSPTMQRLYRVIERVSQNSCPVLILGESGTGKELVARSIHTSSPRRTRPFVPVDCTALVPMLIESELFGYVKGAFTGALQSRHGLIEASDGGTLFLDEIAELPIDLQAKLLRAIQEKEVRPVGSVDRIPIAMRVIAATNCDLETAVRERKFRQDLYFRLNVIQIKLPPLRERKSDIPLLVHYFLEKFAEPERKISTISEDAMASLVAYDWPGNVRELENVVERAMALGSGPILQVADLPTHLNYATDQPLRTDELLPLEELERRAILRALCHADGDKLAAARSLGIGKTTLYRKLKDYGCGGHDAYHGAVEPGTPAKAES